MRPLPWRRPSNIGFVEDGEADQDRPIVGSVDDSAASGPRRKGRRAQKRLFDAVVICGLLPFIIIVLAGIASFAAAVAMSTGESVLFLQDRVGLNGRVFRMWKFRTMVTNRTGAKVTLVDDDRVTALGRFLRQSHLDELPQIWNVLKGEMSLIGPRPEQPALVRQYTLESPEFALRLSVLPGITGWAQVCSSYAGDHAETMIKLAHDLYYIENQTLALDMRILARTAVVMARGSGR
jgi:lipopolysaccharide/colanic/teichoic acid biosynthesis glycosyltransferase